MQHRIEEKVTKPAIPVRIEHGIPAYLTSDEALIHTLDRYPAGLVDIRRYDFGENGKIAFTPGRRGHAAGETILDAVKNGQLRITLNSVERAHPGLWAEILLACRSLGVMRQGAKGRKLSGRLVISSATARFPCRFDPANVILFHLRGFQRVWIYPTDEEHLPQTEVEKTVAGQVKGEHPHNRVEDKAAWHFGIVPGEALAWPLHAPHYSENEEGLCVSVIVTYETVESHLANGVHRANSVRRRWGHDIRPIEQTPFLQRVGLWLASLLFSALGLIERDGKPARGLLALRSLDQDWQIDRRGLAS